MKTDKTIVQKFGGTSVGSIEKIKLIASKILATQKQGFKVVVVVSAMTGETDRLLQLASEFTPRQDHPEVDVISSTGEMVSSSLMSLALENVGLRARSFLGFQLPIYTSPQASEAQILTLNPQKIFECLNANEVPVIAGFQGVNANGRITTLGRGGSDTTAIAIAAALKTPCEIYTDVKGVFSADPKLCEEAYLLPQVSYPLMLEAAGLGAKVMNANSISLGMKYQVPLSVTHSFIESKGTLINSNESDATCITLDENISKVSLFTDKPLRLLSKKISENKIPFSMLTQLSSIEKKVLIPKMLIEKFTDLFKEIPLFVDSNVARVSVVGNKIQNRLGDAPLTLSHLRRANIPCLGVSQNNLSLSFLVPKSYSSLSVKKLHNLYTTQFQEVS